MNDNTQEACKSFNLKPFESSNPRAQGVLISTKVSLLDTKLLISFHLTDPDQKVILQDIKSNPSRVIGLWNQTCFEFFLKCQSTGQYIEFNISPSHDWNIFHFSKLGDELNELSEIQSLIIQSEYKDSSFTILFKADLRNLPNSFNQISDLYISTTAVINIEDTLSYWAIKHTDDRPNFHHPESYIKLIDTLK